METQDKVFFVTFLFTLSLLIFFLDGSITANVIKTSYCNDEGCFEFCRTNAECSFRETCCKEKDFGICKSGCEEEFVFNPNMALPPETARPVQLQETNYLYIVLIFITLSLGILFYYLRNKHLHIKF